MTQQLVSPDAALERAWARIGRDHWHQMKWLVEFANRDMTALSQGDILNLQDECRALQRLPITFHAIPPDRKRYPFLWGSLPTLVPEMRDLINIQSAIAPHLKNIADGKEASLGPIHVTHTTRFRKTTDAERKGGYPPHVIYPVAILGAGSRSWPNEFLLRTARLLEEFVDNIRRCPHCQKVFLQARRNATYCGRACHSVAGMRRRREEQRTQKKLTLKKKRPRTMRKGGSDYGKNGR